VEEQDLLTALLELAEENGMEVRAMPATADGSDRAGSLVRLKGKDVLFLSEVAAPADQIAAVAAALKGRVSLENRYLQPEVRKQIEEAGERD